MIKSLKIKIIATRIGLILSFFLCYLQWGGNNSGFFFDIFREIINKSSSWQQNFVHPFILGPLLGLSLIILSLFVKKHSYKMAISGQILTGLLVLFVFLIGLFNSSLFVLLSTIPYLLLSSLHIRFSNEQKLFVSQR